MSDYMLCQVELPDFDLRYVCTASYVVKSDGVHPVELTLLHVVHTGYEVPADEGYDPEPVIFDVRHTYQQLELEKRLMADFEDVILERCKEHASCNAGVLA